MAFDERCLLYWLALLVCVDFIVGSLNERDQLFQDSGKQRFQLCRA